MLLAIVIVFSNSIVYAATTNSSSTATQTANSEESNSSLTSNVNVLNVNVDDKGSVDYIVPVSAANEDRENQPFSWDNASVYFVLTDRFYNGDTSNDHSYGRSVGEVDADNYATRQGTFHGGDLKGLTDKLEEGYFDKLGINAIWITAPMNKYMVQYVLMLLNIIHMKDIGH